MVVLAAAACGRSGDARVAEPNATSTATPTPTAHSIPAPTPLPTPNDAARDLRSDGLAAAGFGAGDARDDVRSWGGSPGGAVALRVERSAIDESGGHATLRVVALARAGGALRASHSATFTVDRPDCVEGNGPADAPTALLDLAPYRLDSETMAVGVRVTCGRSFPAGEGSRTTLHLLRPNGAALERVLDVTVEDHDHQRGPGDFRKATAVVILEPKAGRPADLVVRHTIETGRLDEPEKPKRATKVERFKWDGARYRAQVP